MYAVDSFDSTPLLATFAPRLAYGLGVVEFTEFLILVIGSLFEHRSTASSLARTRPPNDGAVRTPPSRTREGKPCVLYNFISFRISTLFTWVANPHSSVRDESDRVIELNPYG